MKSKQVYYNHSHIYIHTILKLQFKKIHNLYNIYDNNNDKNKKYNNKNNLKEMEMIFDKKFLTYYRT